METLLKEFIALPAKLILCISTVMQRLTFLTMTNDSLKCSKRRPQKALDIFI